MLAALARAGVGALQAARVLEIGCGTGHWLRRMLDWGVGAQRLAGVDLLAERIAAARALCPAPVTLQQADASRLPFACGEFDLVLQSTVFSSILDPAVRRAVAAEMLRVLAEGGVILWYDTAVPNPRNRDVRPVPAREVAALFQGCVVQLRRATLAPPLARRLAGLSPAACLQLQRLPFLRTHLVGTIRRASAR